METRFGRLPNYLVSSFYNTVLTETIEALLRQRFDLSSESHLVARHSSTKPNEFNMFLSDVDLSFHLSESDWPKIGSIRTFYSELKKAILILGEIEIYTLAEAKSLQHWMSLAGHPYSTIRAIRKIVWMEEAYKQAPSEYHRYKAVRAIQRILQLLKIPGQARPRDNYKTFSASINRIIKELFLEEIRVDPAIDQNHGLGGGFAFHLDYLNSKIMTNERASNQEFGGSLVLEEKNALFLAAISPQLKFGNVDIDRAIANLRRESLAIQKVWRAFSEIECLTIPAVIRGHPQSLPWMLPAEQTFRSSLVESLLLSNS